MNNPPANQETVVYEDKHEIDLPGISWTNRQVLWIVTSIGAIFTLGLLAFAAIGYLSGNQTILERQPSLLLSILAGLLEISALIAGIYFSGIRRRHTTWKSLFGSRLSARWIWISIVIAPPLILIMGFIGVSVEGLSSTPAENSQAAFIAPDGFSWVNLIIILIVAGFLAPLAEEIFFRGVIFCWLRGHWRFWIAALISSVIFGTLHGSLPIIVVATLIGIILATLYEKSHSLWTAVLVHAIFNSANIIILYISLGMNSSF